MQKAYITALYALMEQDERVLSLLSDSGTDYDAMMASDMPRQCFNFGIAEQNKLGIAAGLALRGRIPFVYTSGAFLAYRGLEFIRDDVCYQNQNVKIVGMGSGTSWRTLGPSHHTTEDLAVLRALPHLRIFSAATPRQAAAMVRAAYELSGPVYLRLGMSGEREFFAEDYRFTPGKGDLLRQGGDAGILCTGSILEEVMAAAELLAARGIDCAVADMGSVKPLDEALVWELAQRCRVLLSVEEHSVYGGLGGAVAEVLAARRGGCPLQRVGLRDAFAAGYGTQAQLRHLNGLDAASLANAVEGALEAQA